MHDIVLESGRFFVVRAPYGFDVYEQGVTAAKRVARIGYKGQQGLDRAKLEIEKGEIGLKLFVKP